MRIEIKALERTQLYSEELGIDLSARSDAELFKWFLASLLFGARITETIAKHTYRALERHGLLTPEKILEKGMEYLVFTIMAEGGYVRYDGRKSSQLLRDCQTLLDRYGGSLNTLHESAEDSKDLEKRLLAFYGAGPVTVNIFLRELRPFWEMADPDLLPSVEKAAKTCGIDLSRIDRKSLRFARIEAGLIRRRKEIGRQEG
jgi:endonuclease III